MSSILFAGAAGEVTGSRHLLKLPQGNVLLDCGMFQGRREESKEKTRRFLFDPASVDAVLLSHAHIDHCGSLPLLVKQGFKGPIYCSPATAELAKLLLDDSARIQEQDAYYFNKRNPGKPIQPDYNVKDVEHCASRFRPVHYALAQAVLPGVKAHFHEAGHILGSAQVSVRWEEGGKERSLLFSGDLGRHDTALLKDPFQPRKQPDVLLLESTYGDREHGQEQDPEKALEGALKPVLERGGKVIVPSFAVGRTQELVYHLANLAAAGRLPQVPLFVDSPLAGAATRLFQRHRELMDEEFHANWKGKDPFNSPGVTFTESKEESQAINHHRGPCVILSASGMCESGRVIHHLANHGGDPKNLILFVGFQAQGTLGRRLRDGAKTARLFGEEMPILARVQALDEFSAHAGRSELLAYGQGLEAKPAKTWLVHGELQSASSLGQALKQQGWDAEVPLMGREAAL